MEPDLLKKTQQTQVDPSIPKQTQADPSRPKQTQYFSREKLALVYPASNQRKSYKRYKRNAGIPIRASLATRATERDYKKEKKGKDKINDRKHEKRPRK